MTQLAKDVLKKLQRRRNFEHESIDEEEIDNVLRSAGVSTATHVPVPRHLRIDHVIFGGQERPPLPDESFSTPTPAGAPFEFSWMLSPGLHVVGSARNLRGKSTVLEVMLWALRGRSNVQNAVAKYIDYVDVAFLVDDEKLTVRFDVVDGEPRGELTSSRFPAAPIAAFSNKVDFEAVMEEAMMTRLQLPVIQTFNANNGAVDHAWPTYAGALAITVKGIEQLIGDVAFGIGARLLQMFVGTEWAANRAQADTAQKSLQAQIDERLKNSEIADASRSGQRAEAELSVAIAQTELAALPRSDIDLKEMNEALSAVYDLSGRITHLEVERSKARSLIHSMQRELEDEQRRRHQLIENAVAVRFFNRHEPTACPRCTSHVTLHQRQEEASGHACSVCHGALDMDAFAADVLIADSAAPTVKQSALEGAALLTATLETADPADNPTDALIALNGALDTETARLHALEKELAQSLQSRGAALKKAAPEGVDPRMRLEAELALARAQGALSALSGEPSVGEDIELPMLQRRLAILKAAADVTRDRVGNAQRSVIDDLAVRVFRLARAFGMEALTGVEMTGSPSMRVYRSGVPENYGSLTRGEQLRLKVALAVALLEIARESGIGRHPGLLLVDSPGAEEIAAENVDAMIGALAGAAAALEGVQVVIATRTSAWLEELVDEDHRRIAEGDGYLW